MDCCKETTLAYDSYYLSLSVEQIVQNIAAAHLIALKRILTTLTLVHTVKTYQFQTNIIHGETVKMMSETSIFNNFILKIDLIKIPYSSHK